MSSLSPERQPSTIPGSTGVAAPPLIAAIPASSSSAAVPKPPIAEDEDMKQGPSEPAVVVRNERIAPIDEDEEELVLLDFPELVDTSMAIQTVQIADKASASGDCDGWQDVLIDGVMAFDGHETTQVGSNMCFSGSSGEYFGTVNKVITCRSNQFKGKADLGL